jgi:hypothetical protein
MGKMETVVAQKIRRTKVQRAILGTIQVAGVMSLALVLPNAVQLLRFFDKDRHRKSDPKYATNRAFWKLVNQGYIAIRQTPEGKVTELTAKGRKVVSVLDHPNVTRPKPKRWDGKWRVLVFDIGEKKRGVRDHLRRALTQIGFVQLQRSVWVYPYDCEDFIKLLKVDFRIGSEVIYMIVDQIENDLWLKEYFLLKH